MVPSRLKYTLIFIGDLIGVETFGIGGLPRRLCIVSTHSLPNTLHLLQGLSRVHATCAFLQFVQATVTLRVWFGSSAVAASISISRPLNIEGIVSLDVEDVSESRS